MLFPFTSWLAVHPFWVAISIPPKADKGCGHVELIPHCCKSRFVSSELVEGCPTCGKHATDDWANQVLNALLDEPYHHLIMAIPWSAGGGRIVIIMNRKAGLNLLVHAATEAIGPMAFSKIQRFP